MPILPNDIGWLRGVNEPQLVANQHMISIILQCNDLAILFFKGDEGGYRHGQTVEVEEELVDDLILLPHFVEVLVSNESTALSQS